MTYIALAAGLALLAGFFTLAFRPPREFVLVIQRGRAELRRGRAPAEFVDAVAEVCRDFGLQKARVEGLRTGRHVTLSFSGNVPTPLRQRIRNLWNLPR